VVAQIHAFAVSVKLFLGNDFKLDVHNVWSHEVGPYLRNRWSYFLGEVPNAVECSSREQREWIGEGENRKRNQKCDEIYTFFRETSSVDVFVSRRAWTLKLFRWRRKPHFRIIWWRQREYLYTAWWSAYRSLFVVVVMKKKSSEQNWEFLERRKVLWVQTNITNQHALLSR